MHLCCLLGQRRLLTQNQVITRLVSHISIMKRFHEEVRTLSLAENKAFSKRRVAISYTGGLNAEIFINTEPYMALTRTSRVTLEHCRGNSVNLKNFLKHAGFLKCNPQKRCCECVPTITADCSVSSIWFPLVTLCLLALCVDSGPQTECGRSGQVE